ncbi:hypothetical protein [Candidatus Nitrotoga sp. M5]|uniref:hypothetical protein n=1 Tax=Candidatus Nitrotoga sp. M5 TaxID=2890409 RepID=UPI001EF602B3|nr:hypothetical protein [Candidatus Nitrotoga sp. M5]CAH1387750.1 hypothetical protein NTGM5_70040 [Candidatus Nitrotoga sp. M5]
MIADHKFNAEAHKVTAIFCWGIALGIGTVGSLLLLFLGGMDWANIVSAVILIGVSVAVGKWDASRHRTLLKLDVAKEMGNANARFEIELANSIPGGLEEVCTEVMPICSRQVKTACNQTETAIMDLTKRFVCINAKLEASVSVLYSAVNEFVGSTKGEATALISQSESSLNIVIDSLREPMNSCNDMLEQVRSLNNYAGELRNMTVKETEMKTLYAN